MLSKSDLTWHKRTLENSQMALFLVLYLGLLKFSLWAPPLLVRLFSAQFVGYHFNTQAELVVFWIGCRNVDTNGAFCCLTFVSNFLPALLGVGQRQGGSALVMEVRTTLQALHSWDLSVVDADSCRAAREWVGRWGCQASSFTWYIDIRLWACFALSYCSSHNNTWTLHLLFWFSMGRRSHKL